MGFVRRNFGANQAQALADPVNVGVNRHRRHPQGKAEDDAGGLGANARQLPQPGFGRRQRHFPQKGQVQGTAVQFQNFGQHLFDARRFYLGQAAAADGGFNIGYRGGGYRFQIAEPLHQAAESPFRIGVGSVLRENGKGQFMDGIQARLLGKGAVGGGQQGNGLGHRNGRRRGGLTAAAALPPGRGGRLGFVCRGL